VIPLAPIVFLLDVENPVLGNDRIEADLKRHLTETFGDEGQERYWAIFEMLRGDLGYAVECIGDLLRYDRPALLAAGHAGTPKAVSESF
jgi:hypothetical protein